MSLRAYNSKRRISRSGEPEGRKRSSKPRRGRLGFVVQKHAAKRLHYDFRLEMDGVLKSWALPKGVPIRRGQKSLAVQVEDHPLDYGRFEGIIPEGNYGAGTVMLWDRGKYEVPGGKPLGEWRSGLLAIQLHGRKLTGAWALVRMRQSERNEEGNAWLLIKTGDDARQVSSRADNTSVRSGRTLKQIAARRSRVWHSRAAADVSPSKRRRQTSRRTRPRTRSR